MNRGVRARLVQRVPQRVVKTRRFLAPIPAARSLRIFECRVSAAFEVGESDCKHAVRPIVSERIG